MLRKQTVWLLAMLSLIVVLSVYYMSSDPSPSDPLALSGNQDQEQNQEDNNQKKSSDSSGKEDAANKKTSNNEVKKAMEDQEESATTQVADEEAFAAAKNDMERARSKKKAQYTKVVGAEDTTPQEKAKAKEKIDHLQKLSSKEETLQSLIVAKGYDDALVSANGDDVSVIVKANKLSNEQVVDIITMVKDHLDNDPYVAVSFRPDKG